MYELIRLGGFPMWFILAFGLIALGCAVRYAVTAVQAHLEVVRAMALATLYSTLGGTVSAFGAVFLGFGRDDRWQNDPKWVFILIQGLGESMSPGIIGFTLLSLTALVVAVGASRAARQAS